MTYAAVTARTRQRGGLEFGLLIHGLPYIFVTGGEWATPTTIAGITGNLTVLPFLECDGIEEELELDPKEWNLKTKNMKFTLVDGRGSGTIVSKSPHALTRIFGRKIGGVTSTRLAGTLSAAEVGVALVEDVSGFAASGDFYCGLETVGYATKDTAANPDEFETLTRAKYGSEAVQHLYSLDAGGARPEGHSRPLVTSAPISMHGRYVTLYVREVRADGTFHSVSGVPEQRYLGRIMGSVQVHGPEWTIPTENVWMSIDSKIPSRERGAQLREIAFGRDLDVAFRTSDAAAFAQITPITQRRFSGAEDLASVFVQAVNNALIAAGSAVQLLYDYNDDSTRTWYIDDGVAAGDEARLELIFDSLELGTALGFDTNALSVKIGTVLGGGVRTHLVQAGVMHHNLGPIDVGVSDATVYSAFALSEDADAEGAPTYDVRSYVLIGNRAHLLFSVDAGAAEITVRRSDPFDGWAAVQDDREFQLEGEPPIEVREFVRLQGTWWACWKALIESTTVAQDFKGFLRSSIFDWSAIDQANAHSPGVLMNRAVIEPRSLRAMLLEDMEVRGLLPTLSTTGKVSCLPLSAPSELAVVFAVDEGVILADEMLKCEYSRERIINGLVYKVRWNATTEQFMNPPITINDADSQHDNGLVNVRTVENRGMTGFREDDKDAIFAIARNFLVLFGQDFAIIEVPVTIGAAVVIPGNVIGLTDDSVPDPANGDRGVAALPSLVLGVKRQQYEAQGMLTVMCVTDGRRRSGFAPAARILSYVDNGAPAGDTRHQLNLTTGVYAPATTPANTEGSYFLAGMKVELRERDNATAPTIESNTISPAAHNAAGTAVYLTAAPSAAMQTDITNGVAYITLDDYTTASQTVQAKAYLHLCDEITGKIGASADEGFFPG